MISLEKKQEKGKYVSFQVSTMTMSKIICFLSLFIMSSCHKVYSVSRFSTHIPDWMYNDMFISNDVPTMNINGMNEAFIDAFNDLYYDEIRTKLEEERKKNIVPHKKPIPLPSFDDYFIPSWVYKKVFKHNKPRKFKEKNYVFWDRPIH